MVLNSLLIFIIIIAVRAERLSRDTYLGLVQSSLSKVQSLRFALLPDH